MDAVESTADRLRARFSEAAKADAAVEALLVEACRIADRLDRIDEFETGKREWLELLHFRMGDDLETIHVSISNVLSEARQQANTLRALVTSLMQADPLVGGRSGAGVAGPALNPLDEIAKRRKDRAKG